MRLRTLICLITLLSVMTAFGQRTKLRPGRNIFSPQQDVEMGREVAKDAERQLVLINNPAANAYLTALGEQLAAKAPNEHKFPFFFKLVDDRSINAFALPGGPIYVHRGAIEAADNEAQLAGVIGHEIGHIVLRHGTNQVTKAQIAQAPLAVLGGVLGNSSMGQILTQVGGFAAGSILLRYGRDAETQSDLMGTHILYDLNYDPRAMAQFFDKLAKQHKGSKAEQFFSNHPIPENRVARVNQEIKNAGGLPASPRTDSPDFQEVKAMMLSMPEPPKPAPASTANAKSNTPPPAPSTRLVDFQAAGVQLRHPDNWKPQVQGTHIVLAPEGGVIGQGELAYGLLIDVFKPQSARNVQEATDEFVQGIQKANPDMKLVRGRVQTKIGGQSAILTEFSNTSPVGGQEKDVLLTVLKANGELVYFIQVATAPEFAKYQNAFDAVMNSLRLR